MSRKRTLVTFAVFAGLSLALGIDDDDRRMEWFTALCLWCGALYLLQSQGAREAFFRVNAVSAGALIGIAIPHALTGICLGIESCEEAPIILGGLFACAALSAGVCLALAIQAPYEATRPRGFSSVRI